ncbi:hypothetical protein P3T42_004126 [Paraburkholderia sp. GAS38]|uniref:hypothetical protein n=1 Tax=Paraburkholderia sp. GAS38 TaxID=3035133 RepID=UPI003D1F4D4D
MNITTQFRAIAVVSLVLLLQACAASPPQQLGMDDGILQTQIQSKATKVLNGKNVRLTVILSKNTIENINYLEGLKTSFDKKIFHSTIDKTLAEETDPNYFIQWVTKSLTTNFGEVKFYDNPAQAKKSKPDEFAIVNIYFDPLAPNSKYEEADIKIEFFDRNFNYVAAANGTGRISADHWGSPSSSGFAKIRKHQAQVRATSLMTMDRSLSGILVNPVNWHPIKNTDDSK